LVSVSFGSLASWLQAIAAFVVFCALASGTYLLNDLLDLREDRAHPRKRLRPLAAGALDPASGVLAAGLLLVLAVLLALTLPAAFGGVAAAYFAVTLAYSIWLKARLLADVVTLAGLYTLRVIAGAAAIGVPASFWLLAFSVFIFFSLALVKRCAELSMRRERGEAIAAAGGYRVRDLGIVQALGIGSACAAVLVLALYIHSPEVTARLRTPELLWPICPVLLYWLGRAWVIAARGEMHDDPILFAVRDSASLAAAAAALAFFVAAAFVDPTAFL
jgi:4-hydroxybenzoate polyprenyltransferase